MGRDDWPERPRGRRRNKNSAFERRLDEFIGSRDAKANELDNDPSLIAPRSVLEQLAAREVEPSQVLLGWQCGCLGFER